MSDCHGRVVAGGGVITFSHCCMWKLKALRKGKSKVNGRTGAFASNLQSLKRNWCERWSLLSEVVLFHLLILWQEMQGTDWSQSPRRLLMSLHAGLVYAGLLFIPTLLNRLVITSSTVWISSHSWVLHSSFYRRKGVTLLSGGVLLAHDGWHFLQYKHTEIRHYN